MFTSLQAVLDIPDKCDCAWPHIASPLLCAPFVRMHVMACVIVVVPDGKCCREDAHAPERRVQLV